MIGLINLGMKRTGKPSAGNPHAGFDEAGAGNRLTVRLVRHSQRKRGAMDRPDLRSSGASPRPYLMGRGWKRAGKPAPRQSFTRQVNFRDEKTLLGVGEAQVRDQDAVQNVTATAVAGYALLLAALSRVSTTTGQISWGKSSRLLRAVVGCTLPVPDGYGLRSMWPTRPTLAPHLHFLLINPRICSTLPSDAPSRSRPCASLTLHPHQVG